MAEAFLGIWCDAPVLTTLCVDCRLRILLLCLMLCRQAPHHPFSVMINPIHMGIPFAVPASDISCFCVLLLAE